MQQLSVKKISWETFLDKLKIAPDNSPIISPRKTTPSGSRSTQSMEHGSTSKQIEVLEAPRPKVTKTYQRGNKLVFSP